MIKLKIEEKILKKALDKWGAVSQIRMAIEECSEFINAQMKFYRKRATISEVREEIADVLIVMLQMRILLGPELVDNIIEEKMERLKMLVEADDA